MLEPLGRRGPDQHGHHTFARGTIGATRLAIVDPTGGDQPLVDADGRRAVVSNGELYGHRDRRPAAHAFRTACDTELLLALHNPEDDRWVSRVPGMFAFALWDDRRQRLVCARDRFGEKPFYFVTGPDGSLAFASEVGALHAAGRVDGALDRRALSHFVQHGYVHPSESLYAGVHVLPPGHALAWEDGAVRTWRYWEAPEIDERMSFEAAVEGLRSTLAAAVERQLQGDVPVGAFLSGGVDSSTVAALAAGHRPGLPTFTFGFADDTDERPAAAAQAQALGTTHRAFGDPDADPLSVLVALQSVYDEPLADASTVPTWLLAGEACRYVKAVVGGDGADELLGGYLHWSRAFLHGHPDVTLADDLRPRTDRRPWRRRRRSLVPAYQGFRRYFDPAEQNRLGLQVDTGTYVDVDRYGRGEVSDVLRFDLETYLAGDVLVKTDRAAMAHGLEVRSPFLDQEVAEHCLRMPDRHKVDERGEKLALRAAFADLWVPEVRDRPKRGFSGPMPRWLDHPSVRPVADELLTSPTSPLADVVDMDGVRTFAGRRNQQEWTLLVLALWLVHRRRPEPAVVP